MARGIKNDPRTDYALHEVVTGTGTSQAAKNKRWWAARLMGPHRERYARLLMGLPEKDGESQ